MSLEAMKAAMYELTDAELAELVRFAMQRIRETESNVNLTEADFWSVIESIQWEDPVNSDEADLQPAIDRLSSMELTKIYQFADEQARLLRSLDGPAFAQAYQDSTDGSMSADGFLYARCYVLSRGKAYFNQVQENPNLLNGDFWLEELLSLPSKAFEAKTGEEWRFVPKYNYESFFNEDTWEKPRHV